MIWACFSVYGKSILEFMNGRQVSAQFCSILQNNLLEFVALSHGRNLKFKQDDFLILVLKITKLWFDIYNITTTE